MIKFACIAPHPPLLIPSIGQDNLSMVKASCQALNKIETEIYQLQLDAMLVISPHGELAEEAFTINQSPDLTGDFINFGDLSTKLSYKNDIKLGWQIREQLETKMPIRLISDDKLDHGSTVPLFCLTSHLKDLRIVPIGYSFLPLDTHFQFGKLLQEKLMSSNKNIGIIASGDLSHCLTKEAPAGFNTQGKEFDHLLIQLLKEKKSQEIINLDQKLIDNAGECGLRSFAILLGILDGMQYDVEILSYEGPFGVGYLVANFKF